MIEALKRLLEKHRELVSYVFFGGLTTLVNWAVFFPLYNLLRLGKDLSNVIAWTAAVAFAYVVNRRYVFHSRKTGRAVLGEAASFAGGRLASLACEELVLALGTDVLRLSTNPVKLAATVISVVLNYIISKLFVFRKGPEKP